MFDVLISHRGNISGRVPEQENKRSFIQTAIDNNYDVEIDVRLVDGSLFLGHDGPQYDIDLQWLLDRKKRLWIHAKNFGALSLLLNYDLRVFYHQTESHTIISNCGLIWSHELGEANDKSVIPLLSDDDVRSYVKNWCGKQVHGICSDYVSLLNWDGTLHESVQRIAI